MDFTTIDTPESSKQLDGDLISAVRGYHAKRKKYFRNKTLDKIKPQAEVFKYFFIMETLLKQLAAKIVKHSRTIARDISDHAAKNPESISTALQKLNDLDRSLADLEMHSSRQIRMASSLRNMTRQSRNVARSVYASTARKAEVMKRAAQQQAAKQKQELTTKQVAEANIQEAGMTTKSDPRSRKQQQEIKRRLEQHKRMEELRKKGFFSPEKEKVRR